MTLRSSFLWNALNKTLFKNVTAPAIAPAIAAAIENVLKKKKKTMQQLNTIDVPDHSNPWK